MSFFKPPIDNGSSGPRKEKSNHWTYRPYNNYGKSETDDPTPQREEKIVYTKPKLLTLEQAQAVKNWTQFCEKCGHKLLKWGKGVTEQKTKDGYFCAECQKEGTNRSENINKMKEFDVEFDYGGEEGL